MNPRIIPLTSLQDSRPYITKANERRRVATRAVDSIVQIVTSSTHQMDIHLPLAQIQVALPCSMMKCGDVIYRSTLDLAARGEEQKTSFQAIALLAAITAFLFLPPGPGPALYDLYLGSKVPSVSYIREKTTA